MNLQTFDVDFAGQYGLEPAILFQAIGYWCKHNSGKPDRNRDGMVWMYMSRREWRVEFPYIGEGTLRTSIQKLVDEGLLIIANYSEGMYARTTWYTLTALGWELWLKQPKGSAESAKGFGENSQTITTTHSTTTNSTGIPPVAPKGAEVVLSGDFEDFWKVYPNKVGKPAAIKAFLRAKPDMTALIAGLEIWKASPGWQKDQGRFIPHPTTFLNQRRWEDVPVEQAQPKTEEQRLNDAAWERILGGEQKAIA